MFPVRLSLTRNPKCGRGWFAEVDLKTGNLKFLNPVEGSTKGEAEFYVEEGRFYLAKEDFSSWKNSRQAYTIYLAKDGQLIPIATITYINSSKTISADNERVKETVKRAFATAESNKTRTALIEGAKVFAGEPG